MKKPSMDDRIQENDKKIINQGGMMAKNWLDFKELIENYFSEFEIVSAFKEGLHPYHSETGESLPYYKEQPGDFELVQNDENGSAYLKGPVTLILTSGLGALCDKKSDSRSWLEIIYFWGGVRDEYLVDVFRRSPIVWKKSEVEKYLIDQSAPANLTTGTLKNIAIPTPEGTTWNNIKIRLVNQNRIEISVFETKAPYTSRDLGFSTKRTLWPLLEQLARSKGSLFPQDYKALKPNVSNLRKHLKAIFPNVVGNPIKTYTREDGYVCNFIISGVD